MAQTPPPAIPRPSSIWWLAPALVAALACTPAEKPAETPPAAEPAASGPALPTGAEEAARAITTEALRQPIAYLADDRLEGRLPGTEGDRMARRYLVEQFQALGLEPAGENGSWEQTFEIVGITSQPPKTWSFQTAGGKTDLAYGDDYIAVSGVQEDNAALDGAELVFVGYGIEAPEYQWNDFKGVDLRGKVLVMLNSDPDWDPALFEGERRLYYGRWTYKYESAARQGAAGAIIIHTDDSAGYPWQVVQSSWSGEQFELPAGSEPQIQVAGWATWNATARLLTAAGQDLGMLVEKAKTREFTPMPLGITTSLKLKNKISRGVETANVLARLPGSDPKLADQVVIYTAHHDHLGRGEANAAGDDIYNGARDNASGVAQILAIARAFKALPTPPRRSIVFAPVAAEEQGLLGSGYFAQHPTVAPGKMAANVNFDSGNIFGRTSDLIYIGYGKSSLDAVAEAVAKLQDRTVVGDQFPDRGFFYRSDQFNLAKIGVPAMYVDGGTQLRGMDPEAGRKLMEEWEDTHYHQQSDQLNDSWKFDGMIEDAVFGFYAGLMIANADAMPTWKPGDEFEAARLAALKAAGQ